MASTLCLFFVSLLFCYTEGKSKWIKLKKAHSISKAYEIANARRRLCARCALNMLSSLPKSPQCVHLVRARINCFCMRVVCMKVLCFFFAFVFLNLIENNLDQTRDRACGVDAESEINKERDVIYEIDQLGLLTFTLINWHGHTFLSNRYSFARSLVMTQCLWIFTNQCTHISLALAVSCPFAAALLLTQAFAKRRKQNAMTCFQLLCLFLGFIVSTRCGTYASVFFFTFCLFVCCKPHFPH